MVGLLRRVYGIGLSAEAKDVLTLNGCLNKFELQKDEDFTKSIELVSNSRVLRHALDKDIISSVDKERIKSYVTERNPQGILLAMFRYVAVIREADSNFPGFKDPEALSQIPQLRDIFPNAVVINMIRKGEDVAGSTLKFNWGATNHVAGILDWKKSLSKALNDLKLFPEGRVLNLRLEDAHHDFEKFVSKLDYFFEQNYGECRKEELKRDLQQSLGPVKSYQVVGIQGFLVKKLAQNLNYRLGYTDSPLPIWQEFIYNIVAFPFYLMDRAIRGVRLLRSVIIT